MKDVVSSPLSSCSTLPTCRTAGRALGENGRHIAAARRCRDINTADNKLRDVPEAVEPFPSPPFQATWITRVYPAKRKQGAHVHDYSYLSTSSAATTASLPRCTITRVCPPPAQRQRRPYPRSVPTAGWCGRPAREDPKRQKQGLEGRFRAKMHRN